ncbi:MAG: RNA degradosome polyphosphate kinase [Lachnospiraceae bacterium]|nr:RNA degradosome polyphosphate kinase [Lachnospiraceae bacterium]
MEAKDIKSEDLRNPKYYVNRELSWLKFNLRILEEARDRSLPLFERLKFLSITASNMDEFFMVRVASLMDQADDHPQKRDIAGMTAAEQLDALDEEIHSFVQLQYSTWNRSLVPGLAQNGLRMVKRHEELTKKEGEFVDRYFMNSVYPVLTPMAVDSSRPFPLIRNKSLNLGALVRKKNTKGGEEPEFATVQVPGLLPRVVELPQSENGTRNLILLEEIIERNMDKLFLNYNIECVYPFRITRDAEFDLDEDDSEDLLKEIEHQIKKRQRGEAIRLEVDADVDKNLLKFLKKELSIKESSIYYIDGPLDLTFLMKVYGQEGFDHLKAEKFVPQVHPDFSDCEDIFALIREKDVLLHHPYESFDPVVQFVQQASKDPQVLAIKQTLYRVSGNSPIIAALAQAAENGKQVTVLVELKARFDEENNIGWAKMLEKAGCHVIYGLVGLKTHSKITLVVRGEEDGIRRYVHLGTGNYNDSTARLYTDVGMLTCANAIGEDATAVFNMLSGYSEPLHWNKLSLAPLWLKDRFIYLIDREAGYAKAGRNARIIAKMNSLCDPDVIEALYRASCAGVKIDLIVRGICCLKVGIPGVSENISVRSIVGYFLEHSRIFFFENGGKEEIYASSADWMPRNLERRVEILFPIEDPALKEKAYGILDAQLKDTLKARELKPDGTYEKVDLRGKERFGSQAFFVAQAVENAKLHSKKEEMSRVFIPRMAMDQ